MKKFIKTKTDLSCGIIALRQNEQNWEVLLVNQFNQRNFNSYWSFPKGHLEAGETCLQAAQREFQEETGIVTCSVYTNKTFDLQYSFLFNYTKINKTVKFFIGLVDCDISQQIKPQLEEVKSVEWFNFSDAFDKLNHKNTKHLLKTVENFIKTKTFNEFVCQSA